LPRISRVRSLAFAGSEYAIRAMVHLGFDGLDWAGARKRFAGRFIMPCCINGINVAAQKTSPHVHISAAREPKSRRIGVQFWDGRYSLSGDSSKRILVVGCSE
jgi:hypothetical protein